MEQNKLNSETEINPEELIALIKAIKFAHHDYSVKQVLKEVQSHGGKWSTVQVNQVKKHMKKLGLVGNIASPDTNSEPMKFYTVGGEDKSEPLKSTATSSSTSNLPEWNSNDWIPIELDVPCDKTGSRPHQAWISLNQAEHGNSSGSKGEILKIQKAAFPDNCPLLLYNKSRKAKTCIHSNAEGYQALSKMIVDAPFNLGKKDVGLKAYFWGMPTDSDLCINVCTKELAPSQPW